MLRQATSRTFVPSNRKVFSDFLAAYTLLACSFGINFHVPNASLFSFALQREQKAGPPGIRYRSAQPAVPEHSLNVQAFDNDEGVATDQTKRNLVVVFTPKIPNAGVKLGKSSNRFAPVLTTFLLPGHAAGDTPQLRQSVFQVTGIRFPFAIRSGEERFQTHVDASWWPASIRKRDVWQHAREDHIPLTCFALDRNSLDFSIDGAMQLDTKRSNMLDVQSRILETDAITVGGELDAIVAVPSSKARITWLFAGPEAPEECLEGFVQSSHRRLRR
jgi:hypothetical protein